MADDTKGTVTRRSFIAGLLAVLFGRRRKVYRDTWPSNPEMGSGGFLAIAGNPPWIEM